MAQKITPNLWYDGNAKEAVDYYVSVFPDSKLLSISYYPKNSEEGLADFQKDMAGKELAIEFELREHSFTAINGGPDFTFNESVSFAVSCKDQAEIDYYWSKLSSVPAAEQCGWCKDKFGLSWQIIPETLIDLMQQPEAYAHMLQMKKMVIADF